MGGGRRKTRGAQFAFLVTDTEELWEDERRFVLTAEEMALMNPNTRTSPIFRTRRDAEITKAIFRRVPVLIREGPPEENPWGISFLRMFDMSNDSHLFRTRAELEAEGWRLEGNVFVRGAARYVPLYEAKFAWHFDHRLGSYGNFKDRPENTHLPPTTPEQHADPGYVVIPWYWVPETEVIARLQVRWAHPWLLGWRDITNSTNERTVIAGVLPRVGVGNKIPLMLLGRPDAGLAASLLACLSSFVFDYAARQKLGGTTLNFFIYKQLPVLPPEAYDEATSWSAGERLQDWVAPRALALTYTARDMAPFARDLGDHGPPFPWDEEKRFLLRCELDAAFFHLYGIEREDVDYIMETFPIVKRKDEAKSGEYRTKRVILEMYNAMRRAMDGGAPYRGAVDEPPSTATASGEQA
jgi:hypothetical protein